jgi:hypothetical protein
LQISRPKGRFAISVFIFLSSSLRMPSGNAPEVGVRWIVEREMGFRPREMLKIRIHIVNKKKRQRITLVDEILRNQTGTRIIPRRIPPSGYVGCIVGSLQRPDTMLGQDMRWQYPSGNSPTGLTGLLNRKLHTYYITLRPSYIPNAITLYVCTYVCASILIFLYFHSKETGLSGFWTVRRAGSTTANKRRSWGIIMNSYHRNPRVVGSLLIWSYLKLFSGSPHYNAHARWRGRN